MVTASITMRPFWVDAAEMAVAPLVVSRRCEVAELGEAAQTDEQRPALQAGKARISEAGERVR